MNIRYEDIRQWVQGEGAAFRIVTDLEPAGGPYDKLFPPTYEQGQYVIETRRVDQQDVQCVLLDSVQSQANRFEEALLDARHRGIIPFPDIEVDFTAVDLPQYGRISLLAAPHRVYDAILRDSLLDGTPFPKSSQGQRIRNASPSNASALLELCPPVLIFGAWNSADLETGGLGTKFARTLVSEIVGFQVKEGRRSAVRIDPLGIQKTISIYRTDNPDSPWTIHPEQARRDKDNKPELLKRRGEKDGSPSVINHGNIITPIGPGGVTVDRARQTTVLSLAGLRKLRFPTPQGRSSPERDAAGRTYLAVLALAAVCYQQEIYGYSLRSRCDLYPVGRAVEMVPNRPGQPIPLDSAYNLGELRSLYDQAVGELMNAGFEWNTDTIVLRPSPQLVELVEENLRRIRAGEGE